MSGRVRHCCARPRPKPTAAPPPRYPPPAPRPEASSPGDLRDQPDLAPGLQWRVIGVLIDLAVDGDRHRFLDLVPEPGEAAVELEDEAAEIVRLDVERRLAV